MSKSVSPISKKPPSQPLAKRGAKSGPVVEVPSDVHRARPILECIANKWSVLIMTVLCIKPTRFNQIMRSLDGITHKALADALKRLERNGLIRREVLPTKPVGVEYTITPLGYSLQAPCTMLYEWALANGPEMERAQTQFDLRRG